MSKIEELLKNEKVEWKRLDEIFYIRTGYTPSKNIKEYWENGEIDWFTIEDIRNRGRILEYANVKISKKGVKKDTFKKNSIILSIIATIGEHALIKTNFVVNQQFMVFTTKEEYDTKVNMNFMNYYFSKVSEYCKKNKRVGNVPTVDTQKILRLEIPIPSIETQEKIVKTLDKFTNYVTELQAELQARTKQYEYYRDMLLSEEYLNKLSYYLEENRLLKLEWKTLDEISVGSLSYGSGASAIDYDGETRYIRITDINDSGGLNKEKASPNVVEEKYILNNEDILFARSGATVGKNYIHLINDKCVYAGYLIRLIVNKEIALPKFVFYCLNTNRYKIFVDNTKSRGSQPNINAKQYGSFKIPIIPIEIQNIVVEILDKFQSLLADTKGLLPQEIEQRQKQYEYYREKLLTFNENSAKREREREHISLIRI